MSVINKMLRDLDKQQQQAHNRGFASFKPQRKSHWLLWGSVPLALLAGWCGQAWYMERFSIKTEQAATAAEVQKGQVHPLAAVAQLVPQAQSLDTEIDAAKTLSEQGVSLQNLVAVNTPDSVTTQAAAKEEGKAAAIVPVASSEQYQAVSAVAQEQVLPVQKMETTDTLSSPELVSENLATVTDVQVTEFDQSAEFTAEQETEIEPDWNETPLVADKPRSLAIEKVQLNPEQQKALLKQKAQKAESGGNLNQAVSYWQQIRQAAPSDSEAYLELSRLAQIQRNDIGAVQILEQANAAGVQDPKLSMALAALALKQLDWAKALSYLHYEPDIFNYVDFYALKAAALQKTSQHAQAVQVFQQLARQQPDQARWWLGMALSYDALQQQEQALLAYRQVAINGQGLSAESLNYVKKRIAALE